MYVIAGSQKVCKCNITKKETKEKKGYYITQRWDINLYTCVPPSLLGEKASTIRTVYRCRHSVSDQKC